MPIFTNHLQDFLLLLCVSLHSSLWKISVLKKGLCARKKIVYNISSAKSKTKSLNQTETKEIVRHFGFMGVIIHIFFPRFTFMDHFPGNLITSYETFFSKSKLCKRKTNSNSNECFFWWNIQINMKLLTKTLCEWQCFSVAHILFTKNNIPPNMMTQNWHIFPA